MNAQLRYHGLATGLADGKGVRLQVATPAGHIREIPLNRAEIIRLLKSTVAALEQLDTAERLAARRDSETLVHEADLVDDLVACGLPRRTVEWSSVTTRTTCQDCIEARP